MSPPEGYYTCPDCEGRGYLITPEFLNALRAEAGVTVETMAEFMDTVHSVINAWFAGYTLITRERERDGLKAIRAAVAEGRTSKLARLHPPRRKQ